MSEEAPMKGEKPGFIAHLMFAALALALAVSWALSGDWVPALGFGVIAVGQVVMAFRARRRDLAVSQRSSPSTGS
jgi:hypothetical protein